MLKEPNCYAMRFPLKWVKDCNRDPHILSNSLHQRGIASQLCLQTKLSLHEKTGPVVMVSGQGAEITDSNGKTCIEGMSGL